MPQYVAITEAARALGCSRRTIERQLAAGAPHERRRGRRVVDVAELERWRRGPDPLELVVRSIEHVARRDCGADGPIWRALGIDEPRALALLVAVYDCAYRAAHAEAPRDYPGEVRRIMARIVTLRAPNFAEGKP